MKIQNKGKRTKLIRRPIGMIDRETSLVLYTQSLLALTIRLNFKFY